LLSGQTESYTVPFRVPCSDRDCQVNPWNRELIDNVLKHTGSGDYGYAQRCCKGLLDKFLCKVISLPLLEALIRRLGHVPCERHEPVAQIFPIRNRKAQPAKRIYLPIDSVNHVLDILSDIIGPIVADTRGFLDTQRKNCPRVRTPFGRLPCRILATDQTQGQINGFRETDCAIDCVKVLGSEIQPWLDVSILPEVVICGRDTVQVWSKMKQSSKHSLASLRLQPTKRILAFTTDERVKASQAPFRGIGRPSASLVSVTPITDFLYQIMPMRAKPRIYLAVKRSVRPSQPLNPTGVGQAL
jgi:hypothetical protein